MQHHMSVLKTHEDEDNARSQSLGGGMDFIKTAESNSALGVLLPAESVPTERVAWSYFKACVTGFAASFLLTGLLATDFSALSLSPGGILAGLVANLFANFLGGFVMLTIAPFLLVPIRIMADIMRILRVRRGMSDVLIGALCGGIMMLPELVKGQPIRLASICFVLGGAVGGYNFWRARGYPRSPVKQRERDNAQTINRRR